MTTTTRGLRTRPRTDVDPPRVELPSAAGGISSHRPRGDNWFARRQRRCGRFLPELWELDFFFCRYRIAANRPWNERESAWYLCSTVEWAIAIQRAVKQPVEIGDKSGSVHIGRSVRCGF